MKLPELPRSPHRGADDEEADRPTVVFRRSLPNVLVALAMVGFTLVGAAGAATFAANPAAEPGARLTGGLIALGFFVYAMLQLPDALRVLRDPRAPLEIGPAGIRDRRLADALIPWSAITRARILRVMNRKSLMFEVDPTVRASLGLPARPMTQFNRAFGFPGFTLVRTGLAEKSDALIVEVLRHMAVEGADPRLLAAAGRQP